MARRRTSSSSSVRDDQFLEKLKTLLFQRGGAHRFTQDSPILSEVWLTYAEQMQDNKPHDRVDLLLTPHRNAEPGELCKCIRDRLTTTSEKELRQGRNRDFPERSAFDLSYSDSHVVVRLSFEELIRVALPLTKWWEKHVWKRRSDATDPAGGDGQRFDPALLQSSDNRKLLAKQIERTDEDPTTEQSRFSDDLLWLIQIVGTIGERIVQPGNRHRGARKIVEVVHSLIGGMDRTKLPDAPVLWLVSHNRKATASINESVPAVKADAAHRLFNASCATLTWAVIDSGIDASHPAFRIREGDGQPAKTGQLVDAQAFTVKRKQLHNNTRVLKTYDFTRFRKLLHVPVDDEEDKNLRTQLKGLGLSADDRLKLVKDLRRGLQTGRFLDWPKLEKILRVDELAGKSAKYEHRKPGSEHGTHVAGILAADWRREDSTIDKEYPDSRPPKPTYQGVCPDLQLYDLQVLDDNGQGDEFAILAALQFVRFANAGRDVPVIHGVNLSLSIEHEVSNYACGRTPVCEECNRVVASGVVVVAAAGNLGYAKVPSDKGVIGSYRDISITDPGNAESVITVGSTHRFQPHTYGVSYFSSRGPTGDGRTKPDLVAPGEKIGAPVPGGNVKRLDGTSMAAPHVSGAAALLMARHNELKGQPARVKQILCETATDLGRERDFQGHGMLDVLRAIQSL